LDDVGVEQLATHAAELLPPRRKVRHDALFVGAGEVAHVLGVKQARDVEHFLGDGEGKLEVLGGLVRLEGSEVEQGVVEVVDEGAEGEAVLPRGGEVVDFDAGVALRENELMLRLLSLQLSCVGTCVLRCAHSSRPSLALALPSLMPLTANLWMMTHTIPRMAPDLQSTRSSAEVVIFTPASL